MKTTEEAAMRSALESELNRRIRNNTSYSLRAFARDLEVDCGTLSKVMAGKRKIGARIGRKFSVKLGLDETMRASATVHDTPQYKDVDVDTFEVVSELIHSSLMELIRVSNFKPNISWIAKALGEPTARVRAARDRLIKIGWLKIDEDGSWVDMTGELTTCVPLGARTAKRNLQKEILHKAFIALDDTPFELRDQSTVTMAIDSSKLAEARLVITQFRRDLAKLLSRGETRDEVYNLSVSLYPLTKINDHEI